MSPLLQQLNDFSMTHGANFAYSLGKVKMGPLKGGRRFDLESLNTTGHFLDKVIRCVYL